MTHPTGEPEPVALPVEDWSGFLRGRVEHSLRRVADTVAVLTDGSVRSSADVVEQWNGIDASLSQAGAITSLLSEVHPDETVRTQAEDGAREVDRVATELGQNRALYDVLAAAEQAAGDLDADGQRLLRLTLRDFRRSGVDRDEATRQRLRELVERGVELGQDFSRAIRDDVRSIRIAPDRLDGLPRDFRDDHPAGADGLVTITTDYPDVIPFRTFATDAEARRELTVQFLTRAWPDNDERLREILAIRAERAALLGYDTWVDFDTEVKMIRTGAAVGEFIDRIRDAAQASAERERAVLLARLQQDRPDATSIDSADVPYYAEVIRRENFDVDAQAVRQYFDFAKVRAGLLDVTGRLFGVTYRPVDAPSWSQDVTSFDVMRDGRRLGRIHLDLHPREGKYKHAAQFDLVTGVHGQSLPEGALVCNFSRGLMEHDDVVTLFHEFGHLMHHVLAGDQRYARFSGVATEWDFVEAPSQMLEEWAWDPQVLASFATDADGTPIPADLVRRMRRAEDFGKGYRTLTQMFYASLAYVLHRGPVDDITDTVRELQDRYDAFDYIDGTHFHTSFGHLEGYTSGYYTYMWSLVIAKDMFTAFDADDLFAPGVVTRYRDRVLARGGSGDAADLVADFLGRPYSFDSFAAWLDDTA